MTLSNPERRSLSLPLSGGVPRATAFLAFWIILSGFAAADLPAGVLATVLATWASLRLSPPTARQLRPGLVAQLILRFLYQSVVAGFDTAWRALDPRLPVRPGLVVYRSNLPPGPTQNVFCTMTSLLPGTLPCGTDSDGNLVIHCLVVDQPVSHPLSQDEDRLVTALGGYPGHA